MMQNVTLQFTNGFGFQFSPRTGGKEVTDYGVHISIVRRDCVVSGVHIPKPADANEAVGFDIEGTDDPHDDNETIDSKIREMKPAMITWYDAKFSTNDWQQIKEAIKMII